VAHAAPRVAAVKTLTQRAEEILDGNRGNKSDAIRVLYAEGYRPQAAIARAVTDWSVKHGGKICRDQMVSNVIRQMKSDARKG